MAPSSKADKKAALDVAAWMFNIVTSVGIIMVNKALMATHGFTFATTLTGLHFATTTILTVVFRWLGYIQPSHLPLSNLIKFVLFANLSIVGMNISLMWNSVGFYQIAKLCMIPVSCLLEVIFDKIHYSRATKLSIVVVLLGVGICTVTDVSVNARGLIAATIAVWSTALQQYYVHFLQKKYSLGSFNLLGHTAPAQAASLLIVGPFVDYWLTNKRVDTYDYHVTSVKLYEGLEAALGSRFSSDPLSPPPNPVVLVISGPSGVGKDAVIKRLQEVREGIHFVVTATSRPKRPNEVDGKDYYFVTKEEFLSMVERNELLEYALVYGDYKGVPKQQIRDYMTKGFDIVLRVDIQGAATLRSILGKSAVFIFLAAESEAALVKRLVARNTETPDMLLVRIATAREEVKHMKKFDYVVVNAEGKLDIAVKLVESIIDAEKARVWQRKVEI